MDPSKSGEKPTGWRTAPPPQSVPPETEKLAEEIDVPETGKAEPAGAWKMTPPPPSVEDVIRTVPQDTPASPPSTLHPRADLDRYKRGIQDKFVKLIDGGRLRTLPVDRQRAEVHSLLRKVVATDPPPVPPSEYDHVIEELLNEIIGFGPLEPLFVDPSISDILVNGPNEVYVERRGVLELTSVRFRDEEHLRQVIDRIVVRVNRRVDESSPMVDARLPDGSRVNAIVPPLSLRGPAVSIRRFTGGNRSLDDLVQLMMLAPEMSTFLQAAVKARLNIVVSGGTGSGKTTFLNALSRFIPDTERVVTIEDSAELKLQQRHVLPLESRPPNLEGKGAITVRDLVRNALRMRPDRIVVGECRGAEALDMLQAMNTGHDGSLTTLHANSPRDVLTRLETMVLMAGYDLPVRVIRQQIAGAIDLIVHTHRLQGGVRRVTAITELVGMEAETITLQDLFEYHQTGVSGRGSAVGVFRGSGIRPSFMERLETAGCRLPGDLFTDRVLLRDF
jgi:pilus assembly protein CpaF